MSFEGADGPEGGPIATPRVLLAVSHLRKVYNAANGPVEAIGDLSFSVAEGEFVCLVGPSGAGKTTLLRCVAGLLGTDLRSHRARLPGGDRAGERHGRRLPGIWPESLSVDDGP